MQTLPIGIQNFRKLRENNCLYVDKTKKLQELIENGSWYFLSRPRRLGKSLMLSTLEEMFLGCKEIFKGLAAEQWVNKQSENPSPVLRLDMSGLRAYSSGDELNLAVIKGFEDFNLLNDINIPLEHTASGMLLRTIHKLYKQHGTVVVLIDEYDKPILDNLSDLKKAYEMREILRSFYTVLKSCDEYLRFVLLTGISKFSKTGVFSAMNNLEDISMDERFGDIAGYTQQELETYFREWIDYASKQMKITHDELLSSLKDYYDGFCFDGHSKLYNPFSVMQCLKKCKIQNYWYTSGSPTFIVKYMKDHQINDPEEYRHIEVSSDFADTHEIEYSTPESFLYQSGYLTIEKSEGEILTLDYPNKEVRKSLVRMYLDEIYHVRRYITLGTQLWNALSCGDIVQAVKLYNTAIAAVPYDDFPNRNEFWYRSLFIMLLKGAGIISYAEVHTFRGRSDLLLQFSSLTVVLEFKFAQKTSQVAKVRAEGIQQMNDREYAKSYDLGERRVITAVLVADDEKRQIIS